MKRAVMCLLRREMNVFLAAFMLVAFSFGFISAEAAVHSKAPIWAYVSKTVVDVAWGLGAEYFGLISEDDGEQVGPRSVSLDEEGNIYIFDVVKSNIKKFDGNGKFIGIVGDELPGYALTVNEGGIFLLDGETIFKYAHSGKLSREFPVAEGIRLFEGYGQWLRVDDHGNLYVRGSGNTYRIGKDVNGEPSLLSEEEQAASKRAGFPNTAGSAWFKVKSSSARKAHLLVENNSGAPLQDIRLETTDTFGLKLFLDQDLTGLIYVQVQRITSDDEAHLEIWVFDERGGLVSRIECPNTYHTTVYKKIEVDGAGNIFQLLTLSEGVKILRWDKIED